MYLFVVQNSIIHILTEVDSRTFDSDTLNNAHATGFVQYCEIEQMMRFLFVKMNFVR